MSGKEIMEKLSFVIFGDNAWRASLEKEGDTWHISYDTHGMNVKQARQTLKNIIALAPCEMDLSVIHGYNGGTAIKEMIWNNKESLGYRLDRSNMTSPSYNPGITNAHIMKAVWNA